MIRMKNIVPEFIEGFDLEHFKQLRSFAKRVKYCNEKLQRIAHGSSRIVYKLDDKRVLKLAKNKKGQAQNNTEGDWALNRMYNDIIAKMIDKDEENDLWIVSEYAKKIDESRFEQLLGVSLKEFYSYLFTMMEPRLKYKGPTAFSVERDFEIDEESKKILDNSEFFNELTDMIVNFDMLVQDFSAITSFGEINGKLVVTDYGITEDTYQTHYDKTKKRGVYI